MRSKCLGSIILVSALISGCAGGSGPNLSDIAKAGTILASSSGGALSSADITAGLKEALTKGSNAVVGQLGTANGFSADPTIRIPLPDTLLKARGFASKVGLAGSFDDLELKLNEAAEMATPQAKSLFVGAIKDMSVQDAQGILQGGDNAATEYFRGKTGTSIESAMRPLIDNALAQVGAVRTFNSLLSKYQAIPLAPKIEADLTGHVVDKGSDGIFHYLAEEEKSIRNNPLERTSDLLKRVFAAQ